LPVLELYPEVHFERSPLLSAKIGMALGLALEGLKKPRNPPVNFLKGEFARQNHQLKIFWDNWGNTAQLTGWLFLIFVVYSIARDSFSSELNDKSVTVLKEQAQSVAKLNKKQANESGIKKYIKENKKIAGDLKALAQVSQMNSALDIIKKLSDASPAKKTIHMDILKLNVEENILTIEGTVASLKEKNQLQQNILQLASDGKINSKNPTLPTPPGKTAFAFSLTMDRGLSKNQ
jgi:general secretion pathway protein L